MTIGVVISWHESDSKSGPKVVRLTFSPATLPTTDSGSPLPRRRKAEQANSRRPDCSGQMFFEFMFERVD
jgi:hypothetical protein